MQRQGISGFRRTRVNMADDISICNFLNQKSSFLAIHVERKEFWPGFGNKYIFY